MDSKLDEKTLKDVARMKSGLVIEPIQEVLHELVDVSMAPEKLKEQMGQFIDKLPNEDGRGGIIFNFTKDGKTTLTISLSLNICEEKHSFRNEMKKIEQITSVSTQATLLNMVPKIVALCLQTYIDFVSKYLVELKPYLSFSYDKLLIDMPEIVMYIHKDCRKKIGLFIDVNRKD